MAYLKINNNDYSAYVNSLKFKNINNYNAQVNAAGSTVVDYINTKRSIVVGIIPINDTVMANLLQDLALFNMPISFLNPTTKQLENGVNCIIGTSDIEYYTIQSGNVMYKAMTLTFTEL